MSDEKPKIERNTIIPDFIISALKEDFPRETHETKTEGDFQQTGIKPAYVIERLNDVLGHDGWGYEIDHEEITDNEAVARVTMNIYLINEIDMTKTLIASRTQWGGNKINYKKVSDARKGAITNAICKCASMFDVAHKAYKGLLPPVEEDADIITDEDIAEAEKKPATTKKKTTKRRKLPEVTDDEYKKAKKELSDFFVEKGLGRNYLHKLMEEHFGKSESKDLKPEEMKALLGIVKEAYAEANIASPEDGEDNTAKNTALPVGEGVGET